MAKKTVAGLQDKEANKNRVKVVKGIKSKNSNHYSFREEMVSKDDLKDYLANK